MKLCPEGIILTPRGRHLHGTCIPPGCTYPESFVSLRPFFRTLCPVSIVLLRVHAAARGTCHVARGATWQTPSSFRRFGASFGVCRVQIGPSVRPLFTKVLGHTDWQTDKQAPAELQKSTLPRGNLHSSEWTTSILLHYDFELEAICFEPLVSRYHLFRDH